MLVGAVADGILWRRRDGAGDSFAGFGGSGSGVGCWGFPSARDARCIEVTARCSTRWFLVYLGLRFNGYTVNLLARDVVAVIFFHLKNLLTQPNRFVPGLGSVVRSILARSD